MSKPTRSLVLIPIALIGIITGGVPAIVFLMVAGNALHAYLFGAPRSGAWVFWVAAIGVGVGLLALAFYLSRRRWRLNTYTVLPRLILVRLLIVASLIEAGVGVLLFSGQQVLLALFLSNLPSGR